ncbi:MAG: hypothetical protein M1829_000893 [Trizodia sp. TS-e1964]|nr:MAG: hypothetical protein M1829_000893 [Trizodia sp. TS-e1964]
MKAAIAIPITLALIYRSWSHNSLTPLGIIAAAITATIHALHPWNLPFALLCVFFLGGTFVTKIKKDTKAQLTLQSSGAPSGEGPRTHVQVLANSAVASVLVLLHIFQLNERKGPEGRHCYPWKRGDLLVVGIVGNYAAVAADTFSSELGILSKRTPRLVTSLTLRHVPRGTNGGVTLLGLGAGLLGALSVAMAAVLLVPFCQATSLPDSQGAFGHTAGLERGEGWGVREKVLAVLAVTLWGGLGSLVDSFLGGWLQASVVDVKSGKVVEAQGGNKLTCIRLRVLVLTRAEKWKQREELDKKAGRRPSSPPQASLDNVQAQRGPSRVVESGIGLLDNNAVNFLMAAIMSVGAMAAVSIWLNKGISTSLTAFRLF